MTLLQEGHPPLQQHLLHRSCGDDGSQWDRKVLRDHHRGEGHSGNLCRSDMFNPVMWSRLCAWTFHVKIILARKFEIPAVIVIIFKTFLKPFKGNSFFFLILGPLFTCFDVQILQMYQKIWGCSSWSPQCYPSAFKVTSTNVYLMLTISTMQQL